MQDEFHSTFQWIMMKRLLCTRKFFDICEPSRENMENIFFVLLFPYRVKNPTREGSNFCSSDCHLIIDKYHLCIIFWWCCNLNLHSIHFQPLVSASSSIPFMFQEFHENITTTSGFQIDFNLIAVGLIISVFLHLL